MAVAMEIPMAVAMESRNNLKDMIPPSVPQGINNTL